MKTENGRRPNRWTMDRWLLTTGRTAALVALAIAISPVSACKEPVLEQSVVYDPTSGAAIYFGGDTCSESDSGSPTSSPSASQYICSQPCNGLSVEYINPATGVTSNYSNSPLPVTFQCCALDTTSSIMHCIGGKNSDPRSIIYRYNIRNDTWIPPVAVPTPLAERLAHSCTVSQSIFYVFGGIDFSGNDVATVFFSYNINTSVVTTTYTSLPSNRYGHQLITLPNNNLMLLFGTQLTTPTSQLQSYTFNPATNAWSSYASTNNGTIPQTLDGASCTSWSSNLNPTGGVFCFGGETIALSPNPHLTYLNLTQSQWTDLGVPAAYDDGRSTFGATVSLIDGGNAVVVKSGGKATGTGVATYIDNSVTCSPADSNNGSGVFYGIPPLGPNTVLGGVNVPVIPSGWTIPPTGGFPIVNASTVVSVTPSPSVSATAGVIPSGSNNVSAGGISGWKLAIAILIPLLVLLCCGIGAWWWCCGGGKKRRAEAASAGAVGKRNSVTVENAGSIPMVPIPSESVGSEGAILAGGTGLVAGAAFERHIANEQEIITETETSKISRAGGAVNTSKFEEDAIGAIGGAAAITLSAAAISKNNRASQNTTETSKTSVFESESTVFGGSGNKSNVSETAAIIATGGSSAGGIVSASHHSSSKTSKFESGSTIFGRESSDSAPGIKIDDAEKSAMIASGTGAVLVGSATATAVSSNHRAKKTGAYSRFESGTIIEESSESKISGDAVVVGGATAVGHSVGKTESINRTVAETVETKVTSSSNIKTVEAATAVTGTAVAATTVAISSSRNSPKRIVVESSGIENRTEALGSSSVAIGKESTIAEIAAIVGGAAAVVEITKHEQSKKADNDEVVEKEEEIVVVEQKEILASSLPPPLAPLPTKTLAKGSFFRGLFGPEKPSQPIPETVVAESTAIPAPVSETIPGTVIVEATPVPAIFDLIETTAPAPVSVEAVPAQINKSAIPIIPKTIEPRVVPAVAPALFPTAEPSIQFEDVSIPAEDFTRTTIATTPVPKISTETRKSSTERLFSFPKIAETESDTASEANAIVLPGAVAVGGMVVAETAAVAAEGSKKRQFVIQKRGKTESAQPSAAAGVTVEPVAEPKKGGGFFGSIFGPRATAKSAAENTTVPAISPPNVAESVSGGSIEAPTIPKSVTTQPMTEKALDVSGPIAVESVSEIDDGGKSMLSETLQNVIIAESEVAVATVTVLDGGTTQEKQAPAAKVQEETAAIQNASESTVIVTKPAVVETVVEQVIVPSTLVKPKGFFGSLFDRKTPDATTVAISSPSQSSSLVAVDDVILAVVSEVPPVVKVSPQIEKEFAVSDMPVADIDLISVPVADNVTEIAESKASATTTEALIVEKNIDLSSTDGLTTEPKISTKTKEVIIKTIIKTVDVNTASDKIESSLPSVSPAIPKKGLVEGLFGEIPKAVVDIPEKYPIEISPGIKKIDDSESIPLDAEIPVSKELLVHDILSESAAKVVDINNEPSEDSVEVITVVRESLPISNDSIRIELTETGAETEISPVIEPIVEKMVLVSDSFEIPADSTREILLTAKAPASEVSGSDVEDPFVLAPESPDRVPTSLLYSRENVAIETVDSQYEIRHEEILPVSEGGSSEESISAIPIQKDLSEHIERFDITQDEITKNKSISGDETAVISTKRRFKVVKVSSVTTDTNKTNATEPEVTEQEVTDVIVKEVEILAPNSSKTITDVENIVETSRVVVVLQGEEREGLEETTAPEPKKGLLENIFGSKPLFSSIFESETPKSVQPEKYDTESTQVLLSKNTVDVNDNLEQLPTAVIESILVSSPVQATVEGFQILTPVSNLPSELSIDVVAILPQEIKNLETPVLVEEVAVIEKNFVIESVEAKLPVTLELSEATRNLAILADSPIVNSPGLKEPREESLKYSAENVTEIVPTVASAADQNITRLSVEPAENEKTPDSQEFAQESIEVVKKSSKGMEELTHVVVGTSDVPALPAVPANTFEISLVESENVKTEIQASPDNGLDSNYTQVSQDLTSVEKEVNTTSTGSAKRHFVLTKTVGTKYAESTLIKEEVVEESTEFVEESFDISPLSAVSAKIPPVQIENTKLLTEVNTEHVLDSEPILSLETQVHQVPSSTETETPLQDAYVDVTSIITSKPVETVLLTEEMITLVSASPKEPTQSTSEKIDPRPKNDILTKKVAPSEHQMEPQSNISKIESIPKDLVSSEIGDASGEFEPAEKNPILPEVFQESKDVSEKKTKNEDNLKQLDSGEDAIPERASISTSLSGEEASSEGSVNPYPISKKIDYARNETADESAIQKLKEALGRRTSDYMPESVEYVGGSSKDTVTSYPARPASRPLSRNLSPAPYPQPTSPEPLYTAPNIKGAKISRLASIFDGSGHPPIQRTASVKKEEIKPSKHVKDIRQSLEDSLSSSSESSPTTAKRIERIASPVSIAEKIKTVEAMSPVSDKEIFLPSKEEPSQLKESYSIPNILSPNLTEDTSKSEVDAAKSKHRSFKITKVHKSEISSELPTVSDVEALQIDLPQNSISTDESISVPVDTKQQRRRSAIITRIVNPTVDVSIAASTVVPSKEVESVEISEPTSINTKRQIKIGKLVKSDNVQENVIPELETRKPTVPNEVLEIMAKLETSKPMKLRKHVKISKIKNSGPKDSVSIIISPPPLVDEPISQEITADNDEPEIPEIDPEIELAETKARLIKAAPAGWLYRMMKKLTELSPSFDFSKFSSSMADISSDVEINDELIKRELLNSGAALSDFQFADLLNSINNEDPKEAHIAFEAISDAANLVGAEEFVAKIVPDILEPSPDELYWIKKIRGSAPGDWWPRFLRQVGAFAPEFDLTQFITRLESPPFDLPKVTDENIMTAFTECNAKFTQSQFYRVKEAIVPGKPLVATSAFKTIVDAVHTIGIKAVLGGVLPSLGVWVADRRPESLSIATLSNAAPEGWVSRFLRKVAQFSPSFDVAEFAQRLSYFPEEAVLDERTILEEMSNCGADLTDEEFSEVLKAINPESPDDAHQAFKSFGIAYSQIGDFDAFMFDIVPTVLTPDAEEEEILKKLQKCARPGWWMRFLEAVYDIAPDFNLYVFLSGLAAIPARDVNNAIILELLAKSNAPLTILEFESVERKLSKQSSSVLLAYKALADAVRKMGPSEFLAVVSPVLAKVEKPVATRSRIIRFVASKNIKVDPIAKDITEPTKDETRSRRGTIRMMSAPHSPEPGQRRSFDDQRARLGSLDEPKPRSSYEESVTSPRGQMRDRFRPETPTSSISSNSPAENAFSDIELESHFAEAKATLIRAAPSGWMYRLSKKLSELTPTFDMAKFASSASEIPSFVTINDDLIREELEMAGAPLTNEQYEDLCSSINPANPRDAFVAFEAYSDAAALVGAEPFISRVIPSIIEPSADELYWVKKIRAAAPGSWWPRYLKRIGRYAPEFDLQLFMTKLGAIPAHKISEETILKVMGECGAKLTTKQFINVKESIVPSKPLVAISAFKTMAEAVRKVGIKSTLGGILPSLGTWVAEKKPQASTIALLNNAAPEGWMARFLRSIGKIAPSFDINGFAENLSLIQNLDSANLQSEFSKYGVSISEAQFNEILSSVNPEDPSSAVQAFKALGTAYKEAPDSAIFTKEILPASLTPSYEEQSVIEFLQKTPPSGWWARVLDGIYSRSPKFELITFANSLITTSPKDVNSDVILDHLTKAKADLTKIELEKIEDQMVSGQRGLIIPAYQTLIEAVNTVGPVQFVNIVSPVLAKAEKKVQRRNRILRVVPVKAQASKLPVPEGLTSPTSKRASLRDVLPSQLPSKLPGKRGSFVTANTGPEIVRSPTRTPSEDARLKQKPSSSLPEPARRKSKARIPSVPNVSQIPVLDGIPIPSPLSSVETYKEVRPRSSIISFSDSSNPPVIEPLVAMVPVDTMVSLDELYPVQGKSTRDLTRRPSEASSLRSIDFSAEREKRKSYLEYLTETSSISSGKSHTRKLVEDPEDTIAAMDLAQRHASMISQSWWIRFVEILKSQHTSFNDYEFVSKLGEYDGKISKEVILSILHASGSPVSSEEYDQALSQITASEGIALEFLASLPSQIRHFGSRRFFKKILPLWSSAGPLNEIPFENGVTQMRIKYSEFNPNTFAFITECQLVSPTFSFFKFINAFSTVQSQISEENLLICFKYAGLEVGLSELRRFMSLFVGFWSLDALWEYSLIIRSVGVLNFISRLSELSVVTVDQCKHAGMAWISSIKDLGPKAKFDPNSFKNAAHVFDPVFSVESFLERLIAASQITDDEDVAQVFNDYGLNLSESEYKEIMTATCGAIEYHTDIFRSWWQFIKLYGIDMYFEVIDVVIQEQTTKNALVMTFLGRLYGLGPNIQFNLRGFLSACKVSNSEFSLQSWCNNISEISRLEEDSLIEAFAVSGVKLDPNSTDLRKLMAVLFGDYDLYMTAMRELHYLLKKLGTEWSVIYMWTLVEQRQQVEQSVLTFKAEIQNVKVLLNDNSISLRFTLRSFIERCNYLQSGWFSEVDFDLRNLLDKLSKTSESGSVNESLISVFKSCGINTTIHEYEHLIGSISGNDYSSGLVVFKMLIVFLKKWGMEWYMFIVWSLLDDKEHDEGEMMRFLVHVKEFGKDAKFDMLSFIERCQSLENSWHSTEDDFDIESFINYLLNSSSVTLDTLESAFRLCGVRTVTHEYIDLCITLTGGDFEKTSIPVISYWVSFLKLWGLQWFIRASSVFFDHLRVCENEMENLDKALTISDNKLDVRSFEWFCLTKNGRFDLGIFLTNLVNYGSDLSYSIFLELLAKEGVEISEVDLTNLLGVLAGSDNADGFEVINKWIYVLKVCGVKSYIFLWRLKSFWSTAGPEDAELCIRAFRSRIIALAPQFSVERFISACRSKNSGWDISKFVENLVISRGEFTVVQYQSAFKASGIDVDIDSARDILSSLSGESSNSLSVAREWILAARVVGVQQLLEYDKPVQEVKKESEGWFSRVIRVVSTGAENAVQAVASGAETAVHVVEDALK